jgi:hypothetical protein
MEMETKKTGFGDPKLDRLLKSIHKSIKQDEYKDESALELIRRVRRETTIRSGD